MVAVAAVTAVTVQTLAWFSPVVKLPGGDRSLMMRHGAVYFIQSATVFGAPVLCWAQGYRRKYDPELDREKYRSSRADG